MSELESEMNNFDEEDEEEVEDVFTEFEQAQLESKPDLDQFERRCTTTIYAEILRDILMAVAWLPRKLGRTMHRLGVRRQMHVCSIPSVLEQRRRKEKLSWTEGETTKLHNQRSADNLFFQVYGA